MRTQRRFAAAALALVMTFSVGTLPANAAKKVNVKKVAVSSSISGDSKTVYVAKGKSVKLATKVTVKPNKKANKKVTYKSSNKKVATVSASGVIKGKKVGTAKITVASVKNKKKTAKITVKVTKAPVTKVTLNAKKKTLDVGATFNLKAKVKAGKGAKKAVAWTTSKKSVVKVSKKGVVKALKAGTATVTAKAIDGSGKKATCKITVSDSVNLTAMDILNQQTVTFTLSKAQQLTSDKVVINTKRLSTGTYQKQLAIDTMTTTDNINYTVILNSDNMINVNDFVQVSIPTLTGKTKVLEKQYTDQVCEFRRDEVSLWKVGKHSRDYFGWSEEGYNSYSWEGNLPAGLQSKQKGNRIEVQGTPTTAGTTTATLCAKDERGNTVKKTIYFAIGSDSQIAGAATPVYTLVSTKSSVETRPQFIGGSDNYKYSIVADPQNSGAKFVTEPDKDGYSSSAKIMATFAAPGDYNVTVRATDLADSNRTCDVVVTFHVQQGIGVGGCVKDATGNPIPGAQIYFDNKNRGDLYSASGYIYTDENGTYSVTVSAGTYDIEASYHDENVYSDNAKAYNYLYKQDLNATRTGFDIALPLYRVALGTNDQSINLKNTDWYVAGEAVGEGNAIYVKPGNYAIESDEYTEIADPKTEGSHDWFNGGTVTTTKTTSKVKLTATANVVNAAVQTAVTKAVQGTPEVQKTEKKYAGAKDTPYTVELDKSVALDDTDTTAAYENNYYYAYKFVPTESGNYKLSNSYVDIYTTDGKKVEKKDGAYALTAKTAYIIGSDSATYASFKITKADVTTTEDPASTTQDPASTTQDPASTETK